MSSTSSVNSRKHRFTQVLLLKATSTFCPVQPSVHVMLLDGGTLLRSLSIPIYDSNVLELIKTLRVKRC